MTDDANIFFEINIKPFLVSSYNQPKLPKSCEGFQSLPAMFVNVQSQPKRMHFQSSFFLNLMDARNAKAREQAVVVQVYALSVEIK